MTIEDIFRLKGIVDNVHYVVLKIMFIQNKNLKKKKNNYIND